MLQHLQVCFCPTLFKRCLFLREIWGCKRYACVYVWFKKKKKLLDWCVCIMCIYAVTCWFIKQMTCAAGFEGLMDETNVVCSCCFFFCPCFICYQLGQVRHWDMTSGVDCHGMLLLPSFYGTHQLALWCLLIFTYSRILFFLSSALVGALLFLYCWYYYYD